MQRKLNKCRRQLRREITNREKVEMKLREVGLKYLYL